jgi:hypothetical protein
MNTVYRSTSDKAKLTVSGPRNSDAIDVGTATEHFKTVLAHGGHANLPEARKYLPDRKPVDLRLQLEWTMQDIKVALGKMKLDKATGPDEIPVEFYLQGGDELQLILLKLCNLALEIG